MKVQLTPLATLVDSNVVNDLAVKSEIDSRIADSDADRIPDDIPDAAVANNSVKLTDEQFVRIDTMLQGIATRKRAYAESVGLDWDTVYQECWLKTMQMIQDLDGEVPDNALIAQCCYNMIVDLGRYQFRRVDQIPIDPAEFATADLNDSNSSTNLSVDSKFGANLPDDLAMDDKLIFNEILDIFPEGTKEKEFVREVAVYCGLLDVGNRAFESLFSLTTSMANEIARNIGFANSSSSGYRGVRDRVRRVLRDYTDGFNIKFDTEEEMLLS